MQSGGLTLHSRMIGKFVSLAFLVYAKLCSKKNTVEYIQSEGAKEFNNSAFFEAIGRGLLST